MDKLCRFISISDKLGYHDSFLIEDGGTIIISGNERAVKYIDEYHVMVNFKCYHIAEFYELVVLRGENIVLPGKGLILKEYKSNYLPYKANSYELVTFPELGEEQYEFSNLRIMRETLPLGMYAYDVRYDDEGLGIACEISDYILINHLGTIIAKKPLMDRSQKKIILQNDICFIDNDR